MFKFIDLHLLLVEHRSRDFLQCSNAVAQMMKKSLLALIFSALSIHASCKYLSTIFEHGRNLVGDTGDVSPPLFQTGGHNMPFPPHFFLFRFCIWRGFKNKSDVCHVLCEELFMLDGRPYVAKLMLKQSLVWYD